MLTSRIRHYFSLPRRVTIVNLLVLAMLFNTAAAAALNSSGSQRTLLCTSSGYQWVDVGTDQGAQAPAGHCVFCLNSGDDEALVELCENTLPKALGHSRFHTNLPRIIPPIAHYSSALARAPPLFL
jgi:hypothetical protein